MAGRSKLYDAVIEVCRSVQHLKPVDSFTRNRDPRDELPYFPSELAQSYFIGGELWG